jgi:hypothetical protein
MLSFMTGTKDKRVLRGGSFIDSIDGSFNHLGKLTYRSELDRWIDR